MRQWGLDNRYTLNRMSTLEELLGIDPESDTMLRAEQLVRNDRALLRQLVEVREEQGLTQEDVAARMGVTQATVSRFESYDSNPTLGSIRRYAHAVEALIRHEVEPDRGQLRDPQERDRWIQTSFGGTTAYAPFRGAASFRGAAANLAQPELDLAA